MGVTGLLQALKPVTAEGHVQTYKGQRVAIDGYAWLHRGAYCCARELCLRIQTDRLVRYVRGKMEMLLHFGVIPVLVLDGGRLPSKSQTEVERQRSRDENLAKAKALEEAGRMAEALEFYQRAVDITPRMAFDVVCVMRQMQIDVLVAPYEADAQMAFLCRSNLVAAVITEDSDLLPYGCPKILTKMDKFGNVREICWDSIASHPTLNFFGFTLEMFARMCVLVGCDYLPGIRGVGIKKAHRLVKDHKIAELIVRALRMDSTFSVHVPENYLEELARAEMTYRHQTVFDPRISKCVHLTPLPLQYAVTADDPEPRDISFLGTLLPDDVAKAIADGLIDPSTRAPFSLPRQQPSQQQQQQQQRRHLLQVRSSASPASPSTRSLGILGFKRRAGDHSHALLLHPSQQRPSQQQSSPIPPPSLSPQQQQQQRRSVLPLGQKQLTLFYSRRTVATSSTASSSGATASETSSGSTVASLGGSGVPPSSDGRPASAVAAAPRRHSLPQEHGPSQPKKSRFFGSVTSSIKQEFILRRQQQSSQPSQPSQPAVAAVIVPDSAADEAAALKTLVPHDSGRQYSLSPLLDDTAALAADLPETDGNRALQHAISQCPRIFLRAMDDFIEAGSLVSAETDRLRQFVLNMADSLVDS